MPPSGREGTTLKPRFVANRPAVIIMMQQRPYLPNSLFTLALAVATLIGFVAPVDAQDRQRNSYRKDRLTFPFDAVDGYQDGKLYILVGTNSIGVELAEIDGLDMNEYPDLAKADALLRERKTKEALQAFQKVRGQTKQDQGWLKLWLDAQMIPLLDAQGRGKEAAEAYIALIDADAPQGFYERAPFNSVAALPDEEKAKFKPQFEARLEKATPRSKLYYALQDLVTRAEPGAEPVTPTPDGDNPDQLGSVTPMPGFLLTGDVDPITRQLARGSYEAALERVKGEMATSSATGTTTLRLYQRGLARLYLAEKEEDPQSEKAQKLYKDAGLDLMTVAVYFENTRYAGPAVLEAALTQMRIGRPDLAKQLLDEAEAAIDPDDDPLKKRLAKLQEELSNADSNSNAGE